MATVAKFSYGAARNARALADWMAIEYADHGRVDWELTCGMRLSTTQKRILEQALLPWLRHNFDMQQSLVSWAANPATTAAVVRSMLVLFGQAATASVAVATILRQAAAVIRAQGWSHIGPNTADEWRAGAVDIVGAVAVVCAREGIDSRLRIEALDALRAHLRRVENFQDSIGDWNDVPGRTKQDVLRVLSTCADDTETI